ncbi:hypothetical protein PM082_004070 [Marasmius tenuissimus]|nr:hypothetical protein PM082_004070 [Marasmius tenuissimus]
MCQAGFAGDRSLFTARIPYHQTVLLMVVLMASGFRESKPSLRPIPKIWGVSRKALSVLGESVEAGSQRSYTSIHPAFDSMAHSTSFSGCMSAPVGSTLVRTEALLLVWLLSSVHGAPLKKTIAYMSSQSAMSHSIPPLLGHESHAAIIFASAPLTYGRSNLHLGFPLQHPA